MALSPSSPPHAVAQPIRGHSELRSSSRAQSPAGPPGYARASNNIWGEADMATTLGSLGVDIQTQTQMSSGFPIESGRLPPTKSSTPFGSRRGGGATTLRHQHDIARGKKPAPLRPSVSVSAPGSPMAATSRQSTAGSGAGRRGGSSSFASLSGPLSASLRDTSGGSVLSFGSSRPGTGGGGGGGKGRRRKVAARGGGRPSSRSSTATNRSATQPFAPPSQRQYSRRRYVWELRNKIAEASDLIDRELAEAEASASAKLALQQAKYEAEEDFHAHTHAVEAAQDAGVKRFMAAIVEKNQRLAELHTEHDMVRLDVNEREPFWIRRFKDLIEHVASVAHTHGWRSDFKQTIKEMQTMFAEDEKEGLFRPLQECIENVNAWKASQFKKQLEAVYESAYEQEVGRSSSYADAVQRLRRIEAEVKDVEADLSAKIQADIDATQAEKDHHNLSRAVARDVLTLELDEDGQPVLPEPPAPERGVVPPSIAPFVERYCRLNDKREAPIAMRKQFHRLLVYCVQAGAWQDAFRVYGAMLRSRTEPDQVTFQSMIAACKHASPPHSAAAVAVLSEMRRQRMPIPATMFNRVIDASRLNGAWRRALTVFQGMQEAGCVPTTATYKVLGEACACAKRADAPEVYAAMKYSGVPEFLCYSACMKAIEGKPVFKAKEGAAKAAQAAMAGIGPDEDAEALAEAEAEREAAKELEELKARVFGVSVRDGSGGGPRDRIALARSSGAESPLGESRAGTAYSTGTRAMLDSPQLAVRPVQGRGPIGSGFAGLHSGVAAAEAVDVINASHSRLFDGSQAPTPLTSVGSTLGGSGGGSGSGGGGGGGSSGGGGGDATYGSGSAAASGSSRRSPGGGQGLGGTTGSGSVGGNLHVSFAES